MSAPKAVREFGRSWDSRVPRGDLHWLMGRVHVGTSDADVESDIRARCTAPGFTPEIVDQAVAYALVVHKRNRALFQRVTRG